MKWSYGFFCLQFFSPLWASDTATIKTFKDLSYWINPEKTHCGAAISENITRHDNINQGIECIKKGHRSVYLTSNDEAKKIDPALLTYVQINIKAIPAPLSQNKWGLIYYANNPKAKKDALLLKKYLLERNLTEKLVATGAYTPDLFLEVRGDLSYLLAILLGYEQEDIIFHYKLHHSDFFSEKRELLKNIDKTDFANYSENLKKTFYEFILQNKKWENIYNKQKRISDEWLDQSQELSINDLEDYCDAFSMPLKYLQDPKHWKQNIHQQTPITNTTGGAALPPPPIFQPQTETPRWKSWLNTLLAAGTVTGVGLSAYWLYKK